MKLPNYIYILFALLLSPLCSQSHARIIHAEWNYQYTENIAGYRLYHENTLACQVDDPNIKAIDCNVDAPDGETWFTLTSFLQDGTESDHSAPFTYVFSSSLIASFSTDKTNGTGPLLVQFNATSSQGDIDTFEWNFNDGNTASGSIVSHTFVSPGSYSVILKIKDTDGAVDQKAITIVVTEPEETDLPPVAVVSTSSSVGEAPLEIQFDGSESSDTDGSIVSYHWDMGDGNTATGAHISYTYLSAGTYYPSLTVTDNDGLSDSISTPIIIQPSEEGNITPTAVIAVTSSEGKAPLQVTFDASKSKDPDGQITYCAWHFGDGKSSTGMTTKHTFAEPGKYTVTLCVVDDEGAESQLAKIVIDVHKENGPAIKMANLQHIFYLLLED